jgi:hypothetical protein
MMSGLFVRWKRLGSQLNSEYSEPGEERTAALKALLEGLLHALCDARVWVQPEKQTVNNIQKGIRAENSW